MRNKTRLASAAALVVMLSLGTLAVVAGPSTPGTGGSEVDGLATGLEREAAGEEGEDGEGKPVQLDPSAPKSISAPVRLVGTRGVYNGSLRDLPRTPRASRPERPEPGQPVPGTSAPASGSTTPSATSVSAATAPTPTKVFAGMYKSANGDGYPPDTSGDVGNDYFVQAVNTSVGIFNKTGGLATPALTFDDFISGTGTLCDTNNYGDPVVVYDTFADRWIVSDFAFTLDASGRMTSDSYQCFAVSQTADPVNGGWYFYAFNVAQGGAMADYPKLGVWPDGIYMSANVFGTSTFKNVRVWAFNKSDFYSGSTSPRSVQFDLPQSIKGTTVFSLLPSNARAQTGTPPAGSPNLFASIFGSYQVRVWKFSANWGGIATLTGPTNVASGSFNVGPSTVSSPANSLDTLSYRLMMQNQYSNIGGTESLWLTHTVGANALAAPRWYQVPVTGGTVGTPLQAATWQPDTNVHRFMPSLAVDRLGNLALGYSVSSSSVNPSIRYAGRLASNTTAGNFDQGEQTLAAGGGSQDYTNRWGDYASMTLDPKDGCTFWFTTEIYDTTGRNWQTRIGSFIFPGCSASGPGAVSAPSAPTNLTCVAASRSRINLAWTDTSDNESGFKVERSSNGSSWTQIATTGANATSYGSTGLSRNTLYYYRIRATNSGGDSAYAGPCSTTTLN